MSFQYKEVFYMIHIGRVTCVVVLYICYILASHSWVYPNMLIYISRLYFGGLIILYLNPLTFRLEKNSGIGAAFMICKNKKCASDLKLVNER